MNWSKQQWSVLGIVAITSFMATFLISSVNIALPAIEQSFGLNAVMLSWVLTSFLLSTAMFLLPAGRWADLSGVRRLFKTGVIIFTLSSVACALSPSGNSLILSRFIQGLGGALCSATGPALLVSSFPANMRGRVLGISVSAVYVGLASGPFVGGFLTQYLGWRSLFYVAVGFGAVTTLIAFLYLGSDSPTGYQGKRPKLAGTFFYMLGLTALVYGSGKIPDLIGWILMGSGILGLVVFWIIESKSSFAVIETRLFSQNRLFAFSNLAALINYSATFAIVFLLSLYLQKIQELNPRDAGMILIAQPLTMAIFSPMAGKWSDRVQPRILASLGMGMCTVGLICFAFLQETTPIWIILIVLFWVGLGFALFSSPNMNTIMGSVNKSQLGLASGSAATMRVVGQIVSMTIATVYISLLFGAIPIEQTSNTAFMQLIKWGFITFSLIGGTGVYFSLARGSLQRGAN